MKIFQAGWHVTKSLSRLVELAVRQVITSALYLAPLAGIGFVSFMVLTVDHDINYLLAAKPPSFWIGAAVVAVLALGGMLIIGMLYIRWVFSLPICVLAGDKPAAAMQKSRDLVSGNFRPIAVIIGGWFLLTLAAAGATTVLLDAFSTFFLRHIGENPTIVIGAVCVVLALYAFTAVVLTFIGFAINCLLITRLYVDISSRQGPTRLRYPPAKTLEGKTVPPSLRKSVWGIAVLTLVETIELARDKIKLNIELKFNGHEKQLVTNVVKIIEDHQFKSRCVISSLNFAGLQQVKVKKKSLSGRSIHPIECHISSTSELTISLPIIRPDWLR